MTIEFNKQPPTLPSSKQRLKSLYIYFLGVPSIIIENSSVHNPEHTHKKKGLMKQKSQPLYNFTFICSDNNGLDMLWHAYISYPGRLRFVAFYSIVPFIIVNNAHVCYHGNLVRVPNTGGKKHRIAKSLYLLQDENPTEFFETEVADSFQINKLLIEKLFFLWDIKIQ